MSPRSTPRPTIADWWQTASTPVDGAGDGVRVAHVALDELGARVEVVGPLAVRGLEQRVEHADLVALLQQRVDDVRADEAGAAGDEDHGAPGYRLAPVPDVILPVLNERDAIPWVLERMPAGYAPIVVDNGSTDGSGELAASLGARVVVEPVPGFGAACFAGLTAAESDVVCFMDCDASFDPRELPRVADPVLAGEAQLMLGARRPVARGAWPLHARAANAVLAVELRRRTKVPLRDLGPMRAAPRQALLDLGLRDRRFGWPLEMVLRASAAGWTIREVGVSYHPRDGRSKVTGTRARDRPGDPRHDESLTVTPGSE